ncbi:hypothetical protein AB833_03930 [Chromatiales bacterium (ex Bugula neritina AB1)]|nr:hypothetical protein AB833_03930 [Chromatiales bacterium (ex Bugula neritina AB1)]
MKCPNCDIALMMTDRKGIEIDFCTQCRGVWLDRGELDKIVELTVEERTVAIKNSQTNDWRPAKSDQARQYVESRDKGRKQYKKRDSIISELFD